MSRIGVDLSAFADLAAEVRTAAAEAEAIAADHRTLTGPAGALVDPLLTAAVARFAARWEHVLRELCDDAHRVADALDVVRALYTDVESGAGQSFASALAAIRSGHDPREAR